MIYRVLDWIGFLALGFTIAIVAGLALEAFATSLPLPV